MAGTFKLQVMGGLASRLRPIIGAIAYCDATDKNLLVDWPRHEPSEFLKEFPIRFKQLYNPSVTLWEEDHKHAWCRKQCCAGGQDALPVMDGDQVFRTCHSSPFLPWIDGKWMRYWKKLVPMAILEARIMAGLANVSRPLVGVVVRYWDAQTGAVGPDWHLKRMRAILGIRPDVQFFLLTDHVKAAEPLHAAFPGVVYEYPSRIGEGGMYFYDRDRIISAAAAIHVMAEHCRWVIGSNHSSYSQLVGFLKGARYGGTHERDGGIIGGDYEDAWNPALQENLEKALA